MRRFHHPLVLCNASLTDSLALHQFGQKSGTTASTVDIVTPDTFYQPTFQYTIDTPQMVERQIEGPKGPHLFRFSLDNQSQNSMTMSPLTPMDHPKQMPMSISNQNLRELASHPFGISSPAPRPLSTLSDALATLSAMEIRSWNPRQVAAWMKQAGFDAEVIANFKLNDIDGTTLLGLKFEDLKELDIPSFGKRYRLWNEIQTLGEGHYDQHQSPVEMPATRSNAASSTHNTNSDCNCQSEQEDQQLLSAIPQSARMRRPRMVVKRNHFGDDMAISPMESVSIVGIEQLLPRQHKCSKGDKCPKHKKQVRQRARFEAGFPISPEKGGTIMMAGNFNDFPSLHDIPRPFSDADPSIVASSDVLGPGQLPGLQEGSLQQVDSRDPQENIRQFLTFQHMYDIDEPPTPPAELAPFFPPKDSSKHTPVSIIEDSINSRANSISPNLSGDQSQRQLPKLTIPNVEQPAIQRLQTPQSIVSPARSQGQSTVFSPDYPQINHRRQESKQSIQSVRPQQAQQQQTSVFSPITPSTIQSQRILSTPIVTTLRNGTPFSEADVPVTVGPMAPVPRDQSSSVPADLPSHHPHAASNQPRSAFPYGSSSQELRVPRVLVRHPKPTFAARPKIAPIGENAPLTSYNHEFENPLLQGSNYAGWMRKRKTKFMRHEWNDNFAVLKGSQLRLLKSEKSADPIEHIDVDDFAVACSTLQSRKLSAAFKSLCLSGKADRDEAAFTFQLIPAPDRTKRGVEKVIGRDAATKSGLSKSHHFSVESREERIEWMRELMLSRALKDKKMGYEVRVNDQLV